MQFRKPITVKSKSGGAFVNGFWVTGSISTSTIQASVQPLSPIDLQTLPENRRDKATFRLYSNYSFNTVGSNNPDIVVIDGVDYEVISLSVWKNNVINHYKAIVAKIHD